MNETLLAASIAMGPDADSTFEIHATFPIKMPAGTTVHLEVEFHLDPEQRRQSPRSSCSRPRTWASPRIDLSGVGTAPSSQMKR